MINDFLAFGFPGPIELLVIAITFGVPILLVILVIKFILKSNKERQGLSLKMDELTEELQQMQKHIKTGGKDGCSE